MTDASCSREWGRLTHLVVSRIIKPAPFRSANAGKSHTAKVKPRLGGEASTSSPPRLMKYCMISSLGTPWVIFCRINSCHWPACSLVQFNNVRPGQAGLINSPAMSCHADSCAETSVCNAANTTTTMKKRAKERSIVQYLIVSALCRSSQLRRLVYSTVDEPMPAPRLYGADKPLTQTTKRAKAESDDNGDRYGEILAAEFLKPVAAELSDGSPRRHRL